MWYGVGEDVLLDPGDLALMVAPWWDSAVQRLRAVSVGSFDAWDAWRALAPVTEGLLE